MYVLEKSRKMEFLILQKIIITEKRFQTGNTVKNLKFKENLNFSKGDLLVLGNLVHGSFLIIQILLDLFIL